MPTILADFLIDNPIIIHLAYLSHLSKDFLLLYVAEFVKSVKVFLQSLQIYLCLPLYLPFLEIDSEVQWGHTLPLENLNSLTSSHTCPTWEPNTINSSKYDNNSSTWFNGNVCISVNIDFILGIL